MRALTCQILAIFLCLFIFVGCGDDDSSSGTENPNSNVMMDESDDGNDNMMDGDDDDGDDGNEMMGDEDADMTMDDLADILEADGNSDVDDAIGEGLDDLFREMSRTLGESESSGSSTGRHLTRSGCPAPNFNTNQTNTFSRFTFDTPNRGFCETRSVYDPSIASIFPNDPNTVLSFCNIGFWIGFLGINNSATDSDIIVVWLDSNRNSIVELNEIYNFPQTSDTDQRLRNNGNTLNIRFLGAHLFIADCG